MTLRGYILKGAEKNIILSPEAVRRLLQSGDGDAALCYLAVAGGLSDALSIPAERAERAFSALESMDLVVKKNAPSAPATAPVPAQAPEQPEPSTRVAPEYTNADLVRALEGNEFRGLAAAVDTALGKKLTTPDQKLLLGLYDDLGLSADVIYLLVNFCIERSADQYGPGRKPTMRQIEREGYLWARLGLMDQDSASVYIRRVVSRREALPRMMRLLRLGDRRPSPGEEKYLGAWSEMGFEDAVIERAYDKTILKCKELKWPYMNKILTSWHQKGLHTLAAVEEGDRPVQSRPAQPAPMEGPGQEDMARMEKLLEKMRNDGKGEM